MALSVMIQQRAIINDALHHHLSPSTHRLGALSSLYHSPMFGSLLHPLFLRACSLPPFGWLLRPIIPLAANQGHDRILFNFFLQSKQFSIPILPMWSVLLHHTSSPSSSPPQTPVVGWLLCVPLSMGRMATVNFISLFIVQR